MKISKKIKEYATQNGFDSVEYVGEWKNYNVYQPFFYTDEILTIGCPQFILEQNGSLEWAEPELALDLLSYFYPDDDEDEILDQTRIFVSEQEDNIAYINDTIQTTCINQDVELLLYSLSRTTENVVRDLIGYMSEVVKDDNWNKIATTIGILKDAPITISDNCSTIKDIKTTLKKYLKETNNNKKKLVIIDNLKLIESNESEQNILDRLQDLAVDYKLPIIILKNNQYN